jgi:hypothetical protein
MATTSGKNCSMDDDQIQRVLDASAPIRPGATKQRGDCTAEDLQAAAERDQVLIIRHLAAAERMEAGQMPACDYEYLDGTWCDNDATYFCMAITVADTSATSVANLAEQTDPLEHIALCSVHRVT